MVIWHLHDQNVSVFLIKNVLAIGLAIKEIHEFTLEVTEVIKDEFHLDDQDEIDCKASHKDKESHKDKKHQVDNDNEKTVFKETDEFKASSDIGV
jgi:hypothetical protein